MTLSPDQLYRSEEPLWFCVKSQPKHEHIAAATLRRMLGLETFAPRIKYRKATKRGTIWFVEAMFPGYLFSRCVYRDNYRGVQAAPGVRGFVRFGDSVASIDQGTVDQIRELMTADEEVLTYEPQVEVGSSVLVADGAFHGLEAVVTQLLPAKDRVKVLLTFLGREIEAEVTAPRLLPAKSARDASLSQDR